MIVTPSTYRIMMIDDNVADMRLMEEAIKVTELPQIATYTTCFSADQAWASLENSYTVSQPYHTILLDLNMPQVGGVELLGRIKADQRFAKIPVFIVTNSDHKADINACRELGADAYFQKPSQFNRLVDFFIAVAYSLTSRQIVSVPVVEQRFQDLKEAA